MKRNCSLELRLLPPSDSLSSTAFTSGRGHDNHLTSPQNQQKQLTIFYGGRVCVCDVTELQARAILMVASREMEDKMRSTPRSGSPPVSPSQLYSPGPPTGLSMKRSLQRFLQKRKRRGLAASPY